MEKKVPISKVYADMTLAELHEHKKMLMDLWDVSDMEHKTKYGKCLDEISQQIRMKLAIYLDGIDFEK